jgi:hypothetical protein
MKIRLSSSVSPLLAVDIAIAAQNGSNGELKVRDYIPGIAAQGALDHLVNWANEQQKQKTLCQPRCPVCCEISRLILCSR